MGHAAARPVSHWASTPSMRSLRNRITITVLGLPISSVFRLFVILPSSQTDTLKHHGKSGLHFSDQGAWKGSRISDGKLIGLVGRVGGKERLLCS